MYAGARACSSAWCVQKTLHARSSVHSATAPCLKFCFFVLAFWLDSFLNVFALIQSILMCAGDLESNSGPRSTVAPNRMSGADNEVHAFLTRLEAGQNKAAHAGYTT